MAGKKKKPKPRRPRPPKIQLIDVVDPKNNGPVDSGEPHYVLVFAKAREGPETESKT